MENNAQTPPEPNVELECSTTQVAPAPPTCSTENNNSGEVIDNNEEAPKEQLQQKEEAKAAEEEASTPTVEEDPLLDLELDMELAEFEHMELSGSQDIFDKKSNVRKPVPNKQTEAATPQETVRRNEKGKEKEKGENEKGKGKEKEDPQEDTEKAAPTDKGKGQQQEKEKEKEREKGKDKEEEEEMRSGDGGDDESDDDEDWVVMAETKSNKKGQPSKVLEGIKTQLRKPNACCVSYCKEEVPVASLYRQQVNSILFAPLINGSLISSPSAQCCNCSKKYCFVHSKGWLVQYLVTKGRFTYVLSPQPTLASD